MHTSQNAQCTCWHNEPESSISLTYIWEHKEYLHQDMVTHGGLLVECYLGIRSDPI